MLMKGGSSKNVILMLNFYGTPCGGTWLLSGQTMSLMSRPDSVFQLPTLKKSRQALCQHLAAFAPSHLLPRHPSSCCWSQVYNLQIRLPHSSVRLEHSFPVDCYIQQESESLRCLSASNRKLPEEMFSPLPVGGVRITGQVIVKLASGLVKEAVGSLSKHLGFRD